MAKRGCVSWILCLPLDRNCVLDMLLTQVDKAFDRPDVREGGELMLAFAGAGVGRVTRDVLLKRFETVHLIEADSGWSKRSKAAAVEIAAAAAAAAAAACHHSPPHPDKTCPGILTALAGVGSVPRQEARGALHLHVRTPRMPADSGRRINRRGLDPMDAAGQHPSVLAARCPFRKRCCRALAAGSRMRYADVCCVCALQYLTDRDAVIALQALAGAIPSSVLRVSTPCPLTSYTYSLRCAPYRPTYSLGPAHY
eukprot:2025847-Rhodomonas_salina.4